MRARTIVTAGAALLLPSAWSRVVLRLLGHRIGAGARIGFSLVVVDRLYMDKDAVIGHANLIRIKKLLMRREARIGRLNVLYGPFSVCLHLRAKIGNANKVTRAPQGPVTVGPALLRLGEVAAITAQHRIDCGASVAIGDFSTLAGIGTQVWTHGYIHEMQGIGRYRIDGGVSIGNNVYIGTGSIISMGVHIGPGVIVGAGTTVARDLQEPGLYVSAALRQLPRPEQPELRADLVRVVDGELTEIVYRKLRKAPRA